MFREILAKVFKKQIERELFNEGMLEYETEKQYWD